MKLHETIAFILLCLAIIVSVIAFDIRIKKLKETQQTEVITNCDSLQTEVAKWKKWYREERRRTWELREKLAKKWHETSVKKSEPILDSNRVWIDARRKNR